MTAPAQESRQVRCLACGTLSPRLPGAAELAAWESGHAAECPGPPVQIGGTDVAVSAPEPRS